MTKTVKTSEKGFAAKSNVQKKPSGELDDKALERVSGGKGCASGAHIKEGVITT